MEFFPKISFDFGGIVFWVFCGAVFIQLIHILLVQLRVVVHKQKESNSVLHPVSVIICARNEEENLERNLPSVLEQDYPNFEVIVVNDQSVDDSKHILRALQKRYKNLRSIELGRDKHRKFGKKLPLTIGIKGAHHEHLVMIDADCYPSSKNWLRELMTQYTEDKDIVIGFGPYVKEKGFLNKLIRFDTTSIAGNYIGLAKLGRPYMAVGRNLSYKASKFFDVNGFKKHYHIQSGDDDLFMQDAAKRKNVGVSLAPEAFVYSFPKKTWSSWIRQKQRHFTTAKEYRLINKIILGIFPMSMILMLISFIILLISYKWWMFVLSVFVLRLAVYWIINGLLLKKLKAGDLVVFYPILELIHFVVIPFIYYSTDRRQTKKW